MDKGFVVDMFVCFARLNLPVQEQRIPKGFRFAYKELLIGSFSRTIDFFDV
jgi:hypothetical protein